MSTILRTIALRLGLCLLANYLAYRFGPKSPEAPWVAVAAGMILFAPVYGVALAKPLMDLISEIRHGVRTLVWRQLEGHHFAFHGHSIRVMEDMHHIRWVRLADVQLITHDTTSAHALRHSYGHQFAMAGEPPQPWLSEEALLVHLAKQGRNPTALRLHHWVEREVAFPARRLREQRGTGYATKPAPQAATAPTPQTPQTPKTPPGTPTAPRTPQTPERAAAGAEVGGSAEADAAATRAAADPGPQAG
jgi:hypothetical protein